MKLPIVTDTAPIAIGPYSQAVSAAGMVFCSGQIALDPQSGEMVAVDDVTGQTRQALTNLIEVLKAAGCGPEHVVKTTVYLKNMDDFPAVNEVYATFFTDRPPARATVEVSRLPKNALVEIDAIATKL